MVTLLYLTNSQWSITKVNTKYILPMNSNSLILQNTNWSFMPPTCLLSGKVPAHNNPQRLLQINSFSSFQPIRSWPHSLLRLRLQTELHDTQSDHHMHKACELYVGLSANQSASHQTHHIALQTHQQCTKSDLFQLPNLVEALVAPTVVVQKWSNRKNGKCTKLPNFGTFWTYEVPRNQLLEQMKRTVARPQQQHSTDTCLVNLRRLQHRPRSSQRIARLDPRPWPKCHPHVFWGNLWLINHDQLISWHTNRSIDFQDFAWVTWMYMKYYMP